MTCFWTGIINSLTKEDYEILKIKPIDRRKIQDMQRLIIHFKKLSTKADLKIKWQNTELKDYEIKELKIFIKEYDEKKIAQGHLTSSCDPFLCLLCDILKWKIIFMYCRNKIVFEPLTEVRKEICFRGSKGHFSKN